MTNFYYEEKEGKLGSNHLISNKTSYLLDDNNSFSFSTSRNKEISLTEYYDFTYEYKNDCLTAGIKFKKTFYDTHLAYQILVTLKQHPAIRFFKLCCFVLNTLNLFIYNFNRRFTSWFRNQNRKWLYKWTWYLWN